MNINNAIFISGSLLLLFITACNDARVDRTHEKEVLVIKNHLKPKNIRGYRNLVLVPELNIDPERKDIVEAGLRSMGEFIVDSNRNIYVVGFKNNNNYIYKFDARGLIVNAFGRRGQGPGELEWPMSPTIMGDRIGITDYQKKFVIYDLNGNLINEIRFRTSIDRVELLKNGKYLVYWRKKGLITADYLVLTLSICDQDFNEFREIEDYKLYYHDTKLTPYFMWRTNDNHIYVINAERDYEIAVYDLDGKLQKKIRKEYNYVIADDEIREFIIGPKFKDEFKEKDGYIPRRMPPIRYFMADNEGKLFVMTYEKGKAKGEYVYDIFNEDGFFIGRKPIGIPWAGEYFGVKRQFITSKHLYYYKELESGFDQLVVYNLRWE